jgi:hypothetical protein
MLEGMPRDEQPAVPVPLQLRHALEPGGACFKKGIREPHGLIGAGLVQKEFDGVSPRSAPVMLEVFSACPQAKSIEEMPDPKVIRRRHVEG